MEECLCRSGWGAGGPPVTPWCTGRFTPARKLRRPSAGNSKTVFADNLLGSYGVRAVPGPRVRRPFGWATSWCSPSSRSAAGSIRSTGRSRGTASVVGVLLVVLGPVPRGRRMVLTGGASHARVGYARDRSRSRLWSRSWSYFCSRLWSCSWSRFWSHRGSSARALEVYSDLGDKGYADGRSARRLLPCGGVWRGRSVVAAFARRPGHGHRRAVSAGANGRRDDDAGPRRGMPTAAGAWGPAKATSGHRRRLTDISEHYLAAASCGRVQCRTGAASRGGNSPPRPCPVAPETRTSRVRRAAKLGPVRTILLPGLLP